MVILGDPRESREPGALLRLGVARSSSVLHPWLRRPGQVTPATEEECALRFKLPRAPPAHYPHLHEISVVSIRPVSNFHPT